MPFGALVSIAEQRHIGQSARVMMGPRPGLRWSRLYPAGGDSALAELTLDGLVWGEARLKNIGLTEVDDARTAEVRVVLRLFASEDGELPLEFDLDEVRTLLGEARAWLLENEQERIPLPE